MQVVCGNCQLSFDAPEGATGLVCPICRGPLRAQSADGSAPKAYVEWSGGDLDDLIAILSAPATSARVEVLGATGGSAAGEVHLLAGGVSDALFGGKSVDDALDKLRAIKGARFRVEPRLPNPADGDLGTAGPESGTLEGRPLAHLMRYCEDYVITCSIEVWRGNENARVEYRRGEISGVTVGGIDAPERLAEVMQWAAGNYRLVVPALDLPATAPKRPATAARTPAPVPAPAPSAQAARQQASGTKTIFGMPMAEVEKARAAAAAATKPTTPAPSASPAPAPAPAPAPTPAPSAATSPVGRPTMPMAAMTPPGVAPSAVPPPVAQRSTASQSATKTMFGVPSPEIHGGFTPGAPQRAPEPVAPMARTIEPETRSAPASAPADPDRKTGARKVSVPAPEVAQPKAAPPIAAPAPAAVSRPETTDPVRRPSGPAQAVGARAEATEAVRRVAEDRSQPTKKEAPIWTYVGVGFVFGLLLLGIYQLVGYLSH